MKTHTNSSPSTLIFVIVLFIVGGITYLPLANKFGYYNDDWYLIYATFSQGIEKFTDIFSIDRPARALLMRAAYAVFQVNPFLYSLSACILRVISGVVFLWLVRMVFPTKKQLSFIMSILFVVYPGFLDHPNAIDYQSHIASLTLAMISIAFSIKALHISSNALRYILIILAVVTQFFYLALMEYFIGMEVLRLSLMFFTLKSDESIASFIKKVYLKLAPYFLTTGAFLFWRVLVFNNQRAATDISSMLSNIVSGSLLDKLWFIINFVRDTLNILFISWAVPLYDIGFSMRLRDHWIGITLALLSLSIIGGAIRMTNGSRLHAPKQFDMATNEIGMILIGLIGVVASTIPIALGDRHIIYPAYSRFTLPGIASSILVIAGLIGMIKIRGVKQILFALLIGTAIFTHYANAVKHVNSWNIIRNFWWQVSWRAPDIQSGTTLITNYPEVGIAEDYFIWGPANLIYYPEDQQTSTIHVKLSAAILSRNTVQKVITKHGIEANIRRGLETNTDYGNVLVISMPTRYSCIHVLNGDNLEFSDKERYEMLLIGHYSNQNLILPDAVPHTPPVEIFGRALDKSWCYYYQKADLARQKGDWETISRLGDEAIAQKMHPIDWVEWMPFIQAYAYTGNEDKVRQLATIINSDTFLKQQACRLYQNDIIYINDRLQDGNKLLISVFCE